MIKSYLTSWEKVCPSQIKFERLAGLSNVIWKVTSLSQVEGPSSIIFRKFGDNEEIISRDQEHYVFTELAKTGLGPSHYGGNERARLEEFYESRCLKPSDVSNDAIRKNVAKSLANLHKVNMDALDKKPMFLKALDEQALPKVAQVKAQTDAFSPVEREWLNEILTLTSDEEINFLKEIVPKSENCIAFSHNDLHSQNILLVERSHKLVLIDFEYSSYNYRGYDIANFFNESTIDYNNPEYPYFTLDETKFPGDDDLIDFIKYYVFFSKFGDQSFDENLLFNDDDYFKQFIQDNWSIDEFNAELKTIFDEVKVCTLLSHYYWILWSVLMGKNSDINFDYILYAKRRFDVYQKLKEQYYRIDIQNVCPTC